MRSSNRREGRFLEFKEDKSRVFYVYDIDKQEDVTFKDVDRRIGRISFARYYMDYIIFVEGNQVKIFDLTSSVVNVLYDHKSSIIALDSAISPAKSKDIEMMGVQERRIPIKSEEESLKNYENVREFLSSLRLITIDTRGIVKLFLGGVIEREVDIKIFYENPISEYNDQLFDMGYPYFIAGNEERFAVTTDYGVIIGRFDLKSL
eukprot:TRINITY_DN13295_c0_g1_i1.p1 TRINITY_DN13295_c0_g1~~TRINITY_DN13295_c0_g1_i1.p1  ORF type:complete len:205 (+),score=38.44 TRINITY_DN13295_c0_g1_i1:360-974(+)